MTPCSRLLLYPTLETTISIWPSIPTPHHRALAGQLQGCDIYYYATSTQGARAAKIFAENLKVIYPDPAKVRTVANTTLGELRLVKAPSNLIELAYHDNAEDAFWIIDNIQLIARTLVLALTEYFGIPFVEPSI